MLAPRHVVLVNPYGREVVTIPYLHTEETIVLGAELKKKLARINPAQVSTLIFFYKKVVYKKARALEAKKIRKFRAPTPQH